MSSMLDQNILSSAADLDIEHSREYSFVETTATAHMLSKLRDICAIRRNHDSIGHRDSWVDDVHQVSTLVILSLVVFLNRLLSRIYAVFAGSKWISGSVALLLVAETATNVYLLANAHGMYSFPSL